MSTITIKIQDAQLNEEARTFAAFSYPPDNVPSAQEHIDAIQSYIQELINPHLSEALAKDPDVLKIKQELLAKEQELAAEIKRKVDEVNGARG